MTKLIAEIGLNHNGVYERGIKLINLAHKAGVDFIKFQYFTFNSLFHKQEFSNLLNLDDSFEKEINKLLLTDNEFIKLLKYCISKNIKFGISFLSPQDIINIDSKLKKENINLNEVISFYKIASGEITDLELIQFIDNFNTNNDILISTGASNDMEIALALKNFKKNKKNITLLHCKVQYPDKYETTNLSRIKYLQEKFNTKVGFSDHTIGIEISSLSLNFNPEYIEKHFTDSRDIKKADNPMSSNFEEIARLKEIINKYENIIGNGSFTLSENEKKERFYARKGIYLKKDIKKGHIISKEDLILLRPSLKDNSASNYNLIINKECNKNLLAKQPITINDIE